MKSIEPNASLFPNFLDDPQQYEASQNFWFQLFENVAGNQVGRWKPWVNDPLHEGMPIFSMMNIQKGRGLVVQQGVPSTDLVWFKAWIGSFGSGQDRESGIPYLGIQSFPCYASAKRFKFLLDEFINKKYDLERVEALCSVIMRNSPSDVWEVYEPFPESSDRLDDTPTF